MRTDVKGRALADLIDGVGHRRLREAARDALRRFEAPDGGVAFPAPPLFGIAQKACRAAGANLAPSAARPGSVSPGLAASPARA